MAKILVVDDDKDIRDSLQAILEDEDYEVETAADKKEGWEKIEAGKPDLMILDVMMASWQDGFEMARELKNNPKYSSLPILMLTGVKERTGLDFKSSVGNDDWNPVEAFLEKPIQPEVLLAEIKKLL
ncbi:MAG: response regulator [Candidatus Krumholzibacteria bacterium]|nr:response regulator [Candidatus Krumholzibacteria bacterium]